MPRKRIIVGECIDRLERFRENALILEESAFTKSMMNDPQRLTLTMDDRGTTHTIEGVDDEMRRALVLTLRMLQQANDDSSFASLDIAIHDMHRDSLINLDQWRHWSENLRNFNESLTDSAQHGIAVSFEDPRLGEVSLAEMSCRDLLDMVIYGDLGHSERRYREQVKAWKQAGLYQYVIYEFNDIAWHCVASARVIRRTDVEPILATLQQSQKDTP